MSTKTKEVAEHPFTPREVVLLANALSLNKNELDIDLEKLAVRLKYASKASANTAWHNVRKKLKKFGEDAAVESGEAVAGAVTDATPVKKRKSADKEGAGNAEVDAETATPKKAKGKGRKAAKTAVAAEVAEADQNPSEAEAETEAPKKAKGRPRKAAPKKKGAAKAEPAKEESGDEEDADKLMEAVKAEEED